MRQVEMTLVKHPGNARRTPQDSVSHAKAVLFAFGQKERPRDDVDLVGDSSDAPAKLLKLQPGSSVEETILRRHVVEVKRRLHRVSGAAVIRRRREVAAVEAAVLVMREPRSQACGHVCGLEVLRISAAWRVLGLGVKPLLRQSFDHPQRIARPLVEVDDVILVVARAGLIGVPCLSAGCASALARLPIQAAAAHDATCRARHMRLHAAQMLHSLF